MEVRSKQLTFASLCQRAARLLSPENAANCGPWLLQNASFNFKFKHLMHLVTLYVLFASDVFILISTPDSDRYFIVANFIALSLLCLELILMAWTNTTVHMWWPPRKETSSLYLLFALDIAVIGVFSYLSFLVANFSAGNLALLDSYQHLANIRLLILARAYKEIRIFLLKTNSEYDNEYQPMPSDNSVALDTYGTDGNLSLDRDENRRPSQSRLSEQLVDAISFKVILITLIILLLFNFTFPVIIDYGSKNYTFWLHSIVANETLSEVEKLSVLDQYILDMSYQPLFAGTQLTDDEVPYILSLQVIPLIPGNVVYAGARISLVRISATQTFTFNSTGVNGKDMYYTSAIFNVQPTLRTQALFNVIETMVVCFVLLIGIIVIAGDVQRLVLDPIERMCAHVQAVSRNLDKSDKPMDGMMVAGAGENLSKGHGQGAGEGLFETKLLEGAVNKMTSLLRKGYGEAGARIIRSNLEDKNSRGGTGSGSGVLGNAGNRPLIEPLIQGVRVYAIVGFCDIHHFEDVNDCLKTDILTFVNTIAEIVHSSVHHWGGQCNKNLGNAFVMIWRLGDDSQLSGAQLRRNAGQPPSDLKSPALGLTDLDRKADQALIAFLKIIAEINRNRQVLGYRTDHRLTKNDKQQFKVRMGFGLHAGWAIEGAVGSIHKVDATYLSPHVNLAARLETASRQYGVPLLLSEEFHGLLSVDVAAKCRKLDRVAVKGSKKPINIFTCDVLQEQLFPPMSKEVCALYDYQPDSSAEAANKAESQQKVESLAVRRSSGSSAVKRTRRSTTNLIRSKASYETPTCRPVDILLPLGSTFATAFRDDNKFITAIVSSSGGGIVAQSLQADHAISQSTFKTFFGLGWSRIRNRSRTLKPKPPLPSQNEPALEELQNLLVGQPTLPIYESRASSGRPIPSTLSTKSTSMRWEDKLGNHKSQQLEQIETRRPSFLAPAPVHTESPGGVSNNLHDSGTDESPSLAQKSGFVSGQTEGRSARELVPAGSPHRTSLSNIFRRVSFRLSSSDKHDSSSSYHRTSSQGSRHESKGSTSMASYSPPVGTGAGQGPRTKKRVESVSFNRRSSTSSNPSPARVTTATIKTEPRSKGIKRDDTNYNEAGSDKDDIGDEDEYYEFDEEMDLELSPESSNRAGSSFRSRISPSSSREPGQPHVSSSKPRDSRSLSWGMLPKHERVNPVENDLVQRKDSERDSPHSTSIFKSFRDQLTRSHDSPEDIIPKRSPTDIEMHQRRRTFSESMLPESLLATESDKSPLKLWGKRKDHLSNSREHSSFRVPTPPKFLSQNSIKCSRNSSPLRHTVDAWSPTGRNSSLLISEDSNTAPSVNAANTVAIVQSPSQRLAYKSSKRTLLDNFPSFDITRFFPGHHEPGNGGSPRDLIPTSDTYDIERSTSLKGPHSASTAAERILQKIGSQHSPVVGTWLNTSHHQIRNKSKESMSSSGHDTFSDLMSPTAGGFNLNSTGEPPRPSGVGRRRWSSTSRAAANQSQKEFQSSVSPPSWSPVRRNSHIKLSAGAHGSLRNSGISEGSPKPTPSKVYTSPGPHTGHNSGINGQFASLNISRPFAEKSQYESSKVLGSDLTDEDLLSPIDDMIHSMIYKSPNTKQSLIEQEFGPFVGVRSGIVRATVLHDSPRRRASQASQAQSQNVEEEKADAHSSGVGSNSGSDELPDHQRPSMLAYTSGQSSLSDIGLGKSSETGLGPSPGLSTMSTKKSRPQTMALSRTSSKRPFYEAVSTSNQTNDDSAVGMRRNASVGEMYNISISQSQTRVAALMHKTLVTAASTSQAHAHIHSSAEFPFNASNARRDSAPPNSQDAIFLTNTKDPIEVFEKDADLVALRSHLTKEFSDSFERGVSLYLSKDWTAARAELERSDRLMREAAPLLGGDGPSLTLLRFMAQYKWKAPEDWNGFRELTSK